MKKVPKKMKSKIGIKSMATLIQGSNASPINKSSINQSSDGLNIKKSIDWSSIINIPNFITSLRMIAAPFVMYMILNEKYAAAFFILLFAAITDSFDGKVARLLNKQTTFGAMLDPVADITLTTCTVIALLIQFHFPLWFGIIILFREAIIIVGGLFCLLAGEFTLAKANLIGKLSRFFQLLTVVIYTLAYVQDYYGFWIYWLMYFTALLTLISTVMYLARAYELISGWKKKG